MNQKRVRASRSPAIAWRPDAFHGLRKSRGTQFTDRTEYHIQNIAAVLGVLVDIAGSAPLV